MSDSAVRERVGRGGRGGGSAESPHERGASFGRAGEPAGPSFEIPLVGGLTADTVDKRIRSALLIADSGHRAAAFYLAEVHDRGLYQVLGMPSAVSYAERSLGMSRRQARELLTVGMRLRELPKTDEAFREGSIAWSRVRRVCAVATPETEVAWLERARAIPHEELDRVVRRARRGDLPPDTGGLSRSRFRVSVELDMAQWEAYQLALEKLRGEMGGDPDLKEADLICEMVRMVLESDADGSLPGRTKVDGSAFRVILREEEAEAEDGPVTGATALEQRVTPPAMRARVLARDGERCRNCGSRRGLQVHHVIWRSKGGPTKVDNLVTLCPRCHGLVHEGLLGVAALKGKSGRGGVDFEFLDAKGRPIGKRVAAGSREALGAVAPSTGSSDAG